VFAATDDVAGETAETKREFSAEIEKSAGKGQERANNEESAAEFAERIHPTKSKSRVRGESKSSEPQVAARLEDGSFGLEADWKAALREGFAPELNLSNIY
jgi:hypothetical protein